jgi:hypothetical protein
MRPQYRYWGKGSAALLLLGAIFATTVKQAAAAEVDTLPAAGALTIGGQPVGGKPIGGKPTGGEWAPYAKLVQSHVMRAMQPVEGLFGTKFRIVANVHLTPAGGIEAVDVLSGTGDSSLDSRIRQAIAAMPAIPAAPPPNMPLEMVVTLEGDGRRQVLWPK